MKRGQKKMTVQTRNTKQRRVILEVLRDAPSHPTASWIHREVRKRIPSVSLGTVYRNLNILKGQGQVDELACKGEFTLAANGRPGLYYVTCRVCGKVVEAEVSIHTDADRQVSVATGFEIRSHCMAFYGRCPECRFDGSAGSDAADGDGA